MPTVQGNKLKIETLVDKALYDEMVALARRDAQSMSSWIANVVAAAVREKTEDLRRELNSAQVLTPQEGVAYE